MSRKVNRLRAKIKGMENRVDHAEFVARQTLGDSDKLQDEIKLLRKRINKIASLGSHSYDPKHRIGLTVQVCMQEIERAQDPYGFIDHVFEDMGHKFHREVDDRVSKAS